MQKQISFTELEQNSKKKLTRRERLLAQMEKVVPWQVLVKMLEPHYPKGHRGRPPIGIERMLRMSFVQQWFGLADEAVEDSMYDMPALRSFVGIDLSREHVPDATTLLKFRRFLEKHNLTRGIFEAVNTNLEAKRFLMRQGTIVDATIISAPSSAKNKDRARDPETHQIRKGKQWYHGIKAHIGVDAESGVVHHVSTTPANTSDVTETDQLLHGQEEDIYGDSSYTGASKRAGCNMCLPCAGCNN